MKFILLACSFVISIAACSKKTSTPGDSNHAPTASLSATITNADPCTATCTITASDIDGDKLSYSWDFGDGTKKDGAVAETHEYNAGKIYTITATVSDGKAPPVKVSATINATVSTVEINTATKYQTMEGFGGFGARDVYWSSGPFTGTDFVNDVINDLGLTILRDNLPTDFEDVNDDSDPYTTDFSKFHYNSLNNHLQYLRDMHAAGLNKLIVSVWSGPAWMKTNNNVNGVKADAPVYNTSPTADNNQLRTDMYEEFAERCVAYIKIIKQETGIDVYAISLQNEPRFTETYESCVFDGQALADLIEIVGKRFKDEGITTKIFMPEDVGYFDGINGLIEPILNDPDAMQCVNIIATHGYAFDGVTAASTDAQTWQAMYNWGRPHDLPLWMTETSGFSNDMKGAMDLSKAMYTAFTFGNVSAWLHWQLAEQTISAYSLMSSSGEKSKRYFISKNVYRYVRPGDMRVQSSTADGTNIYPLAFINDTANTNTIVLINDNASDRIIVLNGTGLPSQFSKFVTSATEDCKEEGLVETAQHILLPANSVTTLYRKK